MDLLFFLLKRETLKDLPPDASWQGSYPTVLLVYP